MKRLARQEAEAEAEAELVKAAAMLEGLMSEV
jgi:hypothetical protein